MLRFKGFIVEHFNIIQEAKKSVAKSSALESDDKGKLHELLLAKHLHPENKLPSHWRSKSEDYGGTPDQVHDRLKAKVGKDAYNEINSHAKNTAAAVMSHLHEHGHIGGKTGHVIHDVHWTSNRDAEHNPGDHEKTTGIKDRNSNADLIITTKNKKGQKKFVGISAKYGSQAKPNFKNSGLDSLEKESGVPKGTYTKLQKKHDDYAESIGYKGTKKDRHVQYKSDVAKRQVSPKSAAAKRATAAEQSSLTARSAMASAHSAALSDKSDSELRNIVRGNVSPPTDIPHIVVHSHVQSDGTSIPRVHAAEKIADEHLNNFENLHVGKGDGIRSTIKGTVKSGKHKGKIMTVASQTFKAASGPNKGTAGVFKLG